MSPTYTFRVVPLGQVSLGEVRGQAVTVVESERIGFEMKKPRRKAMRILMHYIPEGMG